VLLELVAGVAHEPLGEIGVGELHHDLHGIGDRQQFEGIEPSNEVLFGDELGHVGAELFLEHVVAAGWRLRGYGV